MSSQEHGQEDSTLQSNNQPSEASSPPPTKRAKRARYSGPPQDDEQRLEGAQYDPLPLKRPEVNQHHQTSSHSLLQPSGGPLSQHPVQRSSSPSTLSSTLPSSSTVASPSHPPPPSGPLREYHQPSGEELDLAVITRDTKEGDSQAETISSEFTITDMGESAIAMRSHLNMNRMFIDQDAATKIGDSVIQRAQKIVKGSRKSDYGLSWGEKAQKKIKEYCGDTEATFAIQLMNVFYGGERMIPKGGEMTEEQLEDARNWIEEPFTEQGIHFQAQCTFATDSIPPVPSFNNPTLDNLLKEFDRVKTPKPDVAFALKRESLDMKYQILFKGTKCALTTDQLTFHTFFIFEIKSALKSIFEAENQCLRSGAAMTNNRRNFNLAVEEPSVVPSDTAAAEASPNPSEAVPDEDSFTFSLAVSSSEAKLYVNWALIQPGNRPEWHMHRLETYSFDKPLEIDALRQAINNVLDWGCGKRKREIVKQADEMMAAGRAPAFERCGAPLGSKKRGLDGGIKQ